MKENPYNSTIHEILTWILQLIGLILNYKDCEVYHILKKK